MRFLPLGYVVHLSFVPAPIRFFGKKLLRHIKKSSPFRGNGCILLRPPEPRQGAPRRDVCSAVRFSAVPWEWGTKHEFYLAGTGSTISDRLGPGSETCSYRTPASGRTPSE